MNLVKFQLHLSSLLFSNLLLLIIRQCAVCPQLIGQNLTLLHVHGYKTSVTMTTISIMIMTEICVKTADYNIYTKE